VSWDCTLVGRLNDFTRLCPGRGIGTFAVVATSAAGSSPASAWSKPVTPLAPPAAPEGLTALPQGLDAVQVGWLPAAASGAPVAGYLVTVGAVTVAAAADATSVVVTGLPSDQPLRVSVAATSAVGRGAAAVTDLPRLDRLPSTP